MTTFPPVPPYLAESMHPAYRRVRDYSYRTHQRTYNWYSRSINPRFKDVHKQDDVTRFDCSIHNVSHYQDYPNRDTTPKKSPGRRRQSAGRMERSQSPKEEYVRTLMQDATFVSEEVRQKLVTHAKEAALRVKTAIPMMVRAGPGRLNAVINDYHIRETNPGFARNKLGGFYTR